MSGARPSDRAGAPAELSPSVSSKAAHPSRGGFTPGPWNADETRYHADGGDWRNIYGGGVNPSVLAVVKAPESSISANARLIAAAPEIFEALEHIVYGALSLPRFAEEQARAAIAKVRGEQGQ